MKQMFYFLLIVWTVTGLAACTSSAKKDSGNYQRKIYLTEEDYLADLNQQAYKERREAKPSAESEYIFNVQPDTQKNVYFFDERVRPMVPGEPSERDYKNTKRLWEKPKRYSPDQYYGGFSGSAETDNSSGSSTSYEDDYGSDY